MPPSPPVWSYAFVADNTNPPTTIRLELINERGYGFMDLTLPVDDGPAGLLGLAGRAGRAIREVTSSARVLAVEHGLVYFNNAGTETNIGFPNYVNSNFLPVIGISEQLMEGMILGAPLGNPVVYEGGATVQVVDRLNSAVRLTHVESGYTSVNLGGRPEENVTPVAVAHTPIEEHYQWAMVGSAVATGSLNWDMPSTWVLTLDVQGGDTPTERGFGSVVIWFKTPETLVTTRSSILKQQMNLEKRPNTPPWRAISTTKTPGKPSLSRFCQTSSRAPS